MSKTDLSKQMNGAESLVRTLLAGGVDTCFANPGTSEIHLVAALDRVPEMRCVLGLFEGVVTGAADGYARMAEKPACTLLHLGPGLANGLANLHNASRAHVPVVNIVGQHARDHLRYNTPLQSDVEGIARPYSKWLRTSSAVSELGRDAVEAITAARTAPGQIATLIVPADIAWGEGGAVASLPALPQPPQPGAATIERAAAMLRSGLPDGDPALGQCALRQRTAFRWAHRCGYRSKTPHALSSYSSATRGRNSVGGSRAVCPRTRHRTVQRFSPVDSRWLSGPGRLFRIPGARRANSLRRNASCTLWLSLAKIMLAHSMHSKPRCRFTPRQQKREEERAQNLQRPALPTGEITLPGLAAAVGALLPENAIVVDESMTSGRGLMAATKARAAPRLARKYRRLHWNRSASCRRRGSRVSPIAASCASLPMAAACTRCRRCGPWHARASTSPP